jgi:hypothetical protein
MAIIQISKIQQRSGNLVDLPQLDEAQFGWANDARRLFIGTTTPNPIENVEVLTSYSNISFSQVEGSGGSNVNITTPIQPGQILGYDVDTNSWVNTGGNTEDPGNTSYYAGLPVHLGTIANIKIGGGATGYVLETDGTGNLNWTSKGTLRTPIVALSNATPIIMTVANTTPYTNGLEITISGANAANANTIVNGQNFYVKVANNFPTTGNVELYITAALDAPNAAVGTNLGTYTANSGIATASLSGNSTSAAGGSVNTIQFNDGGILNGSANFTITSGNIVALTGNFSASNIAGGNLVSANFFTGVLTTSAQPNITSTGTLASLSVSGNANIGNIGTAGLITATGNLNAGNIITGGIVSATGNGTFGNVTATTFTGALSGAATTAGTVTTNAQPNITSTGTLASLSVSGNANIGNIGTAGIVSATGNITAPFFIGNGSQLTGITVAAGSTIVNGNSNVTVAANSDVSISVAGTSNVVIISNTGTNISGTLSVSGNISGGNLILPNSATITTGANTNTGTITGNWSLSAGSQLNATYADLAEYYEADQQYESGTVLEFGGDKEVTIAEDGTNKVAGVVSTNPAYAMNANCQGIAVAIALQGRVPTKVRGTIHKGDMLVSGGDGYARPSSAPHMGTVIGKSLENFDGIEGIIEVAVGRL